MLDPVHMLSEGPRLPSGPDRASWASRRPWPHCPRRAGPLVPALAVLGPEVLPLRQLIGPLQPLIRHREFLVMTSEARLTLPAGTKVSGPGLGPWVWHGTLSV